MSTPDQSKTDPSTSEALCVPDAGSGLMSVFVIIYRVLAALSLVLFITAVVMVFIDLAAYGVTEMIQKSKLGNNYSIIIESSHEYKLLAYAKKYLTEEPYRVYAQNSIINLALSVVGLAIIIAGFQIGIFAVLKIRAQINNITYKDDMQIDQLGKSFGILGIVAVGCFVLLGIYKSLFIKGYQKKANAVQNELMLIDKEIQSGLTKDVSFLNALTTHNMNLINRIMQQYVTNAAATNNTAELEKLFFTMSLFNYFDSISPVTSDSRPDVMQLFSTTQVNNSGPKPHTLFFFEGTNLVSNIFYQWTENPNRKELNDPKYKEAFSAIADKMDAIGSNVNTKIQVLNDNLSKLKQPSKIKSAFLFFTVAYLVAAFFMTVVIIYVLKITNVWNFDLGKFIASKGSASG